MCVGRWPAARNVWDASQQFMCPRYANGTIECPALPWLMYPFETTYTEVRRPDPPPPAALLLRHRVPLLLPQGSAWQWQWSVPHDMQGLVALYPSPQEYASRLDFFFNASTTWFLGNAIPSPYYWGGAYPLWHAHMVTPC